MPLLSSPRGRASTRERTSGQLLDAAERLLEEGLAYADLPVERIAAEAGVARSTFYMHFRDRRALLLALAQRTVGPLESRLESLRDTAGPPDRKRVRRGIGLALELARDHAPVVRALAEAAAYDEEVRRYRDALEARAAGAVAARMRRARRGDPEAVARVLVTAVAESCARQVAADAPPASDAALADALATVWWQSAYAKRNA